MEDIIEKVPTALIESELTPDKLLRHTNKAHNEIYVVNAHNAPNTMREIGRQRERAFRLAGGGTGTSCDIDHFDTMESPCQQLLVWDPSEKEIIGGYRFILGENVKMVDGIPDIATSHMFSFSDKFLKEYLPVTIELGRSFVTPEYQSTKLGAKALYALDNLWDGLGALTIVYPHIRYLFGKVTMYPSYSHECRDVLLYFMSIYFPDSQKLVTPIYPLKQETPIEKLKTIFKGDCFKEDYRVLNRFIREAGLNIPPLVNAYMSLSPTMRLFGTAVNHEFGEVEESGILLSINEISEEKKFRHINSYERELQTLQTSSQSTH